MIVNHEVPLCDFDALAVGHGDRTTVKMLRKAQLSKQLLRLRALLDEVPTVDCEAFALLERTQRRAPDIVAEILLYPSVATWLAACLRCLRHPSGQDEEIESDLAHLGGIAAAAAVRAGLDVTTTVAVRAGRAVLPSLGSAQLGPPTFDGTAVLRSQSGVTEIRSSHNEVTVPADPADDAPGWQGLRRLHASHAGFDLRVHLDDLDPFRAGHRLGVAPRLPERTVRSWRRILDRAWTILVRHHPDRAEALTAGLTAFVPLTTQDGLRGLSATSADAPGAIAITPPGDPLLFAESLVHEFQHNKLCALLDLVPLHTDGDGERFYAPWREDPRPLGGLLQGAYAYLGVTDFWRREQEIATGPDLAFAQYSYVLWRDQTLRAVDSIQRSGHLTGEGERFLAGMRATLERWDEVPVPSVPAALAEDTAADHLVTWRLRHLRADPESIDRIARAWPDGIPEPLTRSPKLTAVPRPPGTQSARTDLRHRRLRLPDEFAGLRDSPESDAADLAHAREDFPAAIERYVVRLSADPHNDEAWSGLAISAWRSGAEPAAQTLVDFPEVVAALHRRLSASGEPPDPLVLAGWLEPAVRSASRDWT